MQDKHNHINGIENFWNHAKRTLSRYNGIPRHPLRAVPQGGGIPLQLRQSKRPAAPNQALGGAGHVRTIAAWSSVAARAGALKAAARRCAVAPQSGGASLDRTCARSPWCLWPGRRNGAPTKPRNWWRRTACRAYRKPKRLVHGRDCTGRIWDSPKVFASFFKKKCFFLSYPSPCSPSCPPATPRPNVNAGTRDPRPCGVKFSSAGRSC